jgi:hypothetical protein
MTPTRLLIGQILVVLAIILGSIWFATQWAASQLAYQIALGSPWFIIFGRPIYHPWSIFNWWFSFDAYAPTIFDEAGAIAAGGGFIGCGAAIFGSLWRARQRKNITTYGSARWATARDMREAKLFEDAGVFLGRIGPRYLRNDGPEHIMAFAPTRSGKGVGLVVPTLLGWSGSAVIHDIKGEHWQLTAGWRSRFSHCLLFNPTDARSARHNPLLEVRRGTDEVRDVQNIADILVEAMRKTLDKNGAKDRGGVEREADGTWIIAPDHVERAAAFEGRQAKAAPVIVDTLCAIPLDRQVGSDGATWLDRQLVATDAEPLRDAGFGREVRAALDRRRQWLIAQGLAKQEQDRIVIRANLLATLRRRELARVAGQLSDELGLGYAEAKPGERIEGIYRRPVDLVSGRFALIEKAREFTLVPWRPVLDRHIDKQVSGILRGDAINWTIGRRQRSGPSIS